MTIRCAYKDILPIEELKKKFNPKNRNNHPREQLERLAKILKYQGIRAPAKISLQSDLVTAGHGRILAAELAGFKEYPVDYQEYEDEEQEYADLQADNAIADWSSLDFVGINDDLKDLGPDFDLDLLGIKNFTLDYSEKVTPEKEWEGMPEFDQDDKTSYARVVVHFKSEEDRSNFFALIEQKCTDKTRSIWYPEQEWLDTENRRYGDDEGKI